MLEQPSIAAGPWPLPQPVDAPYPGILTLHVDARDIVHGVFQVRQTIPVAAAGPLTLLYPKWIPGFHSPAAAIELLAGLQIWAGEMRLAWRRHPTEVHAFDVSVPEGVAALELRFQFLSPTSEAQGVICVTPVMLLARWSAMLLYPAGYFSRGIQVDPTLQLPSDWTAFSALEISSSSGGAVAYKTTALDVLVDSPVLAGRFTRRVKLDDQVELALVADRADQLAASEDQIRPHHALVHEADALFGARHFDRYAFLVAVSEEIGGGGVEHQCSSEIVTPPTYFTDWAANAPKRDVFAHEYVHAWNGKFRRGADSWTPSFEQPIRNSLMWVYEGQTQYWGEVLAARSGLWSRQQALEMLARTAALYDNRPGGRWRPLIDTTNDPIIASRQPLPWPSWQRSEDYYAEGQLLWLDVDTLIRELSGDRRSLDDFARLFFGAEDGGPGTSTYTFADVVEALSRVQPHDWAAVLTDRLESREVGAPLAGLERGGYRLVYRRDPNDFAALADAANQIENLRFSIGLSVKPDGALQEVIWQGPAFHAGLVAGARLLSVNGRAFDSAGLRQAIVDAEQTGQIRLVAQRGKRVTEAIIRYEGGPRYPHLERIAGARPRLDEILSPHGGSGLA